MNPTNTPTRTRRLLELQGYLGHDDATLSAIAPWTKLAPALCLVWTAVGTTLGSAQVIWALVPFALGGALLPYHPFDLLYNHLLRHLTGTPALPRHGAGRRFACSLATVWLVVAGTGFASGADLVGQLFGWSLVVTATSPVITGLCMPSYLWMRLSRALRAARPA
jgi:hypothetical protein